MKTNTKKFVETVQTLGSYQTTVQDIVLDRYTTIDRMVDRARQIYKDFGVIYPIHGNVVINKKWELSILVNYNTEEWLDNAVEVAILKRGERVGDYLLHLTPSQIKKAAEEVIDKSDFRKDRVTNLKAIEFIGALAEKEVPTFLEEDFGEYAQFEIAAAHVKVSDIICDCIG